MFKLGRMYDYTLDKLAGDKVLDRVEKNENKEVKKLIENNKNNEVNILVIDDSDYKMDSTCNYLDAANAKLNPDCELLITQVDNLIAAKVALTENTYDGVVIDMQFPVRRNEHIDRKAGIDVLNHLKWKKINVPHCINSSGKDSRDSMNDAGFTETRFILNSSGISARQDFEDFYKEVLEHYNGKKETEEI